MDKIRKIIREELNKIKNFDDFLTENYINTTISLNWIKDIVNNFNLKNNKDLFKKSKNKINLELFLPLFEYYQFIKKTKNIKYKPQLYKIREWIWFLFFIETYSDEIISTKDIYTTSIDEYKKLPLLSGNIINDEKIFDDLYKNYLSKNNGKIRNNILLLYVHFEKYM
jgi:hypothetical protein